MEHGLEANNMYPDLRLSSLSVDRSELRAILPSEGQRNRVDGVCGHFTASHLNAVVKCTRYACWWLRSIMYNYVQLRPRQNLNDKNSIVNSLVSTISFHTDRSAAASRRPADAYWRIPIKRKKIWCWKHVIRVHTSTSATIVETCTMKHRKHVKIRLVNIYKVS